MVVVEWNNQMQVSCVGSCRVVKRSGFGLPGRYSFPVASELVFYPRINVRASMCCNLDVVCGYICLFLIDMWLRAASWAGVRSLIVLVS